MKRAITGVVATIGACCLLRGQPVRTRPRFVAADVHAARANESRLQTPPPHDDRYEVKGATMLDLVAMAYGWNTWKIAGGPYWLEMDRFDITAKLPGEISPDDRKLMLQTLLEDRFKLVVRKETTPIPGYALTASNRPALRKAGSEKSGCVPYVSSTPTSMDSTWNTYGPDPIRYTLGPGSTITYNCRNITMDAFAQGLQSMVGANLNPGPVLDATGLKGAWTFDLHWTQQWVHLDRLPPGHVTIFDALDQQLGLKLEERPVPAPALVVVSVNRSPTPNAPDLVRVMPPIPTLTQFEVASVKPTGPHPSRQNRRIEPGRLAIEDFPMRYLFDMAFPTQTIEKMPDWAETVAFDIQATAPPGFAPLNATDLGPPMLALLRDRFRLAYHSEQRPRPAYVIEAAKPKMTRADPARRSSCRRDTAPSGSQGFLTRFTCRNITMAQFADWLSNNGIGLKAWARGIVLVSDSTGLSGGWDFTLAYDPNPRLPQAGSDAAPSSGQPAGATDPEGAWTIFEAMRRQLGLKLVTTSKPGPVIVIDHLDQKPTAQ